MASAWGLMVGNRPAMAHCRFADRGDASVKPRNPVQLRSACRTGAGSNGLVLDGGLVVLSHPSGAQCLPGDQPAVGDHPDSPHDPASGKAISVPRAVLLVGLNG